MLEFLFGAVIGVVIAYVIAFLAGGKEGIETLNAAIWKRKP